jgi:regulation of enolase protein 1 (concanavalin A-like superfamily)
MEQRMSQRARAVAFCVLSILVLASAGRARAATITVPVGGDLQAALDGARPGDTILLIAGATYRGNFVLPAKAGTGTITIRSNAPDSSLPPAGQRMTPAYAAYLPKIKGATGAMAALATAPGAAYYTVQFVEFLRNASGEGSIIELGRGDASQSSLSVVPHDIVIDRCYLHSEPGLGQLRGIALNSGKTTIRDSYISEIKDAGRDSQAIAGWNGPGPYTIVNNYLEAAGENFMMGGSTMCIPNVTPTGIVFRNNYVTKQRSWRGSSWTVKNLLELKHAQDVTIDGNVLENNWQAAQIGFAIVLTPRNQYGDTPWTVVRRITFTNNVVRHVASVFNILGWDYNAASLQTSNITIRNNVFEDVNSANWGGHGRLLLITEAADVAFDHNTSFNTGSAIYVYGNPSPRFSFTNNIVNAATYGVMGSGAAEGNGTIAAYFPDGTFQENVFVGAVRPSMYPVGSGFPSIWADVGFANLSGGDYHLAATSPFKGQAAGGTDPGADIDALQAAQAGGGTVPPPPPPPAGGGLPSPWANADVGSVGAAGSASASGGTFTVRGSGADVWGSADGFHYVYRPLAGDGQIVARVASVGNTNAYAKAGVMLREQLSAGSRHVILDVRPGGSIEFMTRGTTGGSTTYLSGGLQSAPVWLRLARVGSEVTASLSTNGSSWSTVGRTTVSMGSSVSAGLVVCSHAAGSLMSATFDSVSVTAGAAPPPPAPGDGEVVVYAADIPDANLHGSWTRQPHASAAEGVKLASADAGFASTGNPLAAPAHYVDVPFTAVANTPYRLWLRLRALNNNKYNDAVWVQFSDARANGGAVYPIGTTSGLLVNLATSSDASSLGGWGWQNGAYWLSQATTFTFPTTGSRTLRIQVREDGVQFDQVVLSSAQYLSAPPGPVTNDATIVPK